MKETSGSPQGGHVFDLSIGESAQVALGDGTSRRITLVSVDEPRCSVRGIIRTPRVTVDVDGERAQVPAALYHMPQVVNGVKIACSVTHGVAQAVGKWRSVYALEKDARLRCWGPGDPLFGPVPLVYPARQAWFASMTQMANEKVYVDGGELPLPDPKGYIYYHYGLDIGGHDKAVPVVAAKGGRVVLRGDEKAPDYTGDGGETRYDRVVLRDAEGWYFLYSHLDMIEPTLRLGSELRAGDPVGALGKEGASGGWSHLHFGITSPQPSGRYGQVEGYPFLVEGYLHQHPGALLACARPHLVAAPGEPVELDGGRSVCDGGEIRAYRWTFHDGDTAEGARAVRTYAQEGMYSEMLTVTDGRGRTAVDFCVVQILPPDGSPARTPPAMHLTYFPTEGLHVGQPIAFKVRTFFKGPFEANRDGEEVWDFGDGKTATTRSGEKARVPACEHLDFDERWHAYDRPGRHTVTVRRTGKNGLTATAQLCVEVG